MDIKNHAETVWRGTISDVAYLLTIFKIIVDVFDSKYNAVRMNIVFIAHLEIANSNKADEIY